MDARLALMPSALADDDGRPGRGSPIPRSISRTSITIRRPRRAGRKSLDDVDPEILRTYEKLGIPLMRAEILWASRSR